LEAVTARLAELEEEHGGDDGAFAELEKVNKAGVMARVKEIKVISEQSSVDSELVVLEEWLKLNGEEGELKKKLKDAEADLDAKARARYPTLTEAEIKTLVVEDKWLAALETAINGEVERVSQRLTQRLKELAERYATPLPALTARVDELEAKVNRHLEKMGFSWK
jgi:type I restriction enzyme M protein